MSIQTSWISRNFWISMLWISIFGYSILAIQGCSHTQVTMVDYPLTVIQAAVEKEFVMGVGSTSENGREIYSKPFEVKQPDDAKKENFKDRGKAIALILGDTKPYKLEITISIERAIYNGKREPPNSAYGHDHYDERLAKKMIRNIKATLEKRGDRNLLDDFRSF